MYHLIAFLFSAVVVIWTTPVIKTIGIKSGRVDRPDGRKVHQRPMVRLGGVSIFAGTLIALLVVWWSGGFGILPTQKEWEVGGVILGGLAFFLIGLADDLFNLSPFVRLLMQVVVSGLVWWMGVRIEFLSVPTGGLVDIVDWLSLPITVVWLVGMANAINWIDGLDRSAVLFIYSLALRVGSLALAIAGVASGIAYALGATSLLSYTSWQVWQHAR